MSGKHPSSSPGKTSHWGLRKLMLPCCIFFMRTPTWPVGPSVPAAGYLGYARLQEVLLRCGQPGGFTCSRPQVRQLGWHNGHASCVETRQLCQRDGNLGDRDLSCVLHSHLDIMWPQGLVIAATSGQCEALLRRYRFVLSIARRSLESCAEEKVGSRSEFRRQGT